MHPLHVKNSSDLSPSQMFPFIFFRIALLRNSACEALSYKSQRERERERELHFDSAPGARADADPRQVRLIAAIDKLIQSPPRLPKGFARVREPFRFRFREPGARWRIGMCKDVLVRRFLIAAGLLPKNEIRRKMRQNRLRPCLAKRCGRAAWTQSRASGGGQFKPLARR